MKTFEYSERLLLTFLNISNIVLISEHSFDESRKLPIYKIAIEDENYFNGFSFFGKVLIERNTGVVVKYKNNDTRQPSALTLQYLYKVNDITIFELTEWTIKRYWYILKNFK